MRATPFSYQIAAERTARRKARTPRRHTPRMNGFLAEHNPTLKPGPAHWAPDSAGRHVVAAASV